MAVILPVVPVVAKARLAKGEYLGLVTVPSDKSNAVVDITMMYDVKADIPKTKAKLNFYLSNFDEADLRNEKNILFKGVELDTNMIYPEIGKVVIGANQVLSVELVDCEKDALVNIRVSGLTETNPFVLRAGRLHSQAVTTTDLTEIYRQDNPLGAYVNGTISMFNNNTKTYSKTEIFITDGTSSPMPFDKIMNVDLPPNSSGFLENVLLRPNERVLVKSANEDVVFFFNGMETAAVYGGICENGELEDPPNKP